ncbi:DUF4113 domain-containing protein [Methylobacterium sp. Leaf123]|uniref:DUF4113 domain-containing protein n=1 Tax=Methylobacterium sp. Leaf123 TaxID=1736264 RepID=UPI0009EBA75C
MPETDEVAIAERATGQRQLVPARAGLTTKREWNTKFGMRTPRYTTRVSDLPVACA